MGTRLDDFIHLSAVLTGFTEFDLRSTGLADVYDATVTEIVGEETVEELLGAFTKIVNDDDVELEEGLRREILSDRKLGPLARNLMKLWYVGSWYELPAEWREHYGQSEKDRTFVISSESYREGLLWPAVGANPAGAKPHGYGMWALPPRIGTSYDKD